MVKRKSLMRTCFDGDTSRIVAMRHAHTNRRESLTAKRRRLWAIPNFGRQQLGKSTLRNTAGNPAEAGLSCGPPPIEARGLRSGNSLADGSGFQMVVPR